MIFIKKYLLFFSFLILSLLLVNNKVYAQEGPASFNPVTYVTHSFYQQYSYTREYTVIYYAPVPIFVEPDETLEYIMDNKIGVTFKKGYDITTNSYELIDHIVLTSGFTELTFRITIGNTLDASYEDIRQFFENDSTMYVKYYIEPINPDYELGFRDGYNRGYSDGYYTGEQEGYNSGYNTGYNKGYSDGSRASQQEAYQRGYNDGARDSFISKIDKWLVPAIIIVVIAGIFVGYRRERYSGD